MRISSSAPAPNSKSVGCRTCCASPATRRSSPAHPDTSWPPTSCRSLRSRPGSIARRATCIRTAIRMCRTIRATSRWCAKALDARLAQIDPANAAAYQARYADFSKRWPRRREVAEESCAAARAQGRGPAHQGFPYLGDWLGIEQIGALEPKPGVPPTSAHLAEVLTLLQKQPARWRSACRLPGSEARRLAGRARTRAGVVLPFTVGGDAQAKDLFGLFDDTVADCSRG